MHWIIQKYCIWQTGTLTNGAFTVTNIEIFDKDYTENQVIDILIKGESFQIILLQNP